MTDQMMRPQVTATLARLACAGAIGVAFGVLTLWLQGTLPGNWNVLADSGAIWALVAVGAAATLGGSRAASVVAGVLALAGEVAGYYWCAAPWQGIPVTQSEQVLWTAAALVVGPIAGLAGHAVARGGASRRVIALLAVAGLIAGEGLYEHQYVPGHRVAAVVEIALGVVMALGALLSSRAPLPRRAGAAVVGTVVAAAVVFVYANPVLF